MARHATIAYLNARTRSAQVRAIETRTTIGQVQGILMERFGIDADQAFAVLRRYSQHANQPLRDVAIEIVATRQLPTEVANSIAPPDTSVGSSPPSTQV